MACIGNKQQQMLIA